MEFYLHFCFHSGDRVFVCLQVSVSILINSLKADCVMGFLLEKELDKKGKTLPTFGQHFPFDFLLAIS